MPKNNYLPPVSFSNIDRDNAYLPTEMPPSDIPVIIPEEISHEEIKNLPSGFNIVEFYREVASLPHKTPQARNSIINGWQFKFESYRMKKGNEWVDLWIRRLSQYNQIAQTMVQAQMTQNELQRQQIHGRYAARQVNEEYVKFFTQLNADVDRIQKQQQLDEEKHLSALERERRQRILDEEKHQTAMQREKLQRELDEADFKERISEAKKKQSINEDL